MKKNKLFCKGLLCNRWDRKIKCYDCGVYLCGICEVISMQDKRTRCINCYLSTFSPDWDKLNKEFDEMIYSLSAKKETKKDYVITK